MSSPHPPQLQTQVCLGLPHSYGHRLHCSPCLTPAHEWMEVILGGKLEAWTWPLPARAGDMGTSPVRREHGLLVSCRHGWSTSPEVTAVATPAVTCQELSLSVPPPPQVFVLLFDRQLQGSVLEGPYLHPAMLIAMGRVSWVGSEALRGLTLRSGARGWEFVLSDCSPIAGWSGPSPALCLNFSMCQASSCPWDGDYITTGSLRALSSSVNKHTCTHTCIHADTCMMHR